MRVLLAEDDTRIAEFVENGLREAGFAVDRTGDGEQALHLALAISYDAAVVDIMLPRLEYLLRNRSRIVSKTMILEHIWDFHFDPQTNVVDLLVCRLRNKIDRDFPDKLVHTFRGIGYAIKAPPVQAG